MKLLWVLYLIAGAPVPQGEFTTKEACLKALETADQESFGTAKGVTYLCSPWLASDDEGRP